jgi:acyl dehydratase
MCDTSRLQGVQYAAVSRDFDLIHTDIEHARRAGLPDVIVYGSLKAAFIARLATSIAGEWGRLRRLTVEYRGMDVAGDLVTVRGVVEALDPANCAVECRIWTESAAGAVTTRATAVLTLPTRAPA